MTLEANVEAKRQGKDRQRGRINCNDLSFVFYRIGEYIDSKQQPALCCVSLYALREGNTEFV